MTSLMKILISGASIAGPSAAFWLSRHGHDVTVVERAKSLRRGGYAIDVRGVALEVIERMGLRERLRPFETDTESNSIVDAEGRRFGRMKRGFGVIDPNDLELLRGDLGGVLFETTRDHVDYRFGETIAAQHDHGDHVEVAFASGRHDRYDLVIGADGVHSQVRALAFGPESEVVQDLGSAMAIATVPNTLGLVREQLSYNDVKRIATVKSAANDRELKVCLFYPMTREAFDPHDEARQKRQVCEAFEGSGWVLPELVPAMVEAEDFYADLTCQIRIDRYHTGRIALIGDAGYCPSPLSGQGSSLALVGGYVLAHALEDARGDVARALPAYDAAIRGFVVQNQDLAKKLAGGFAPSTPFELRVRNAVMRVLPYLPGTGWIISKAMSGVRDAANAMTLPPLGSPAA
jgi:2-polyprenyl-6-methoxyphenol hydroxylase-like FAD-dependent oxidoreductase